MQGDFRNICDWDVAILWQLRGLCDAYWKQGGGTWKYH